MEYGATIWNPYLKGDIDKLERIQNRGIHFIKKDYRSRGPGLITTMKRQLGRETLEERRHSLRLILLYKVVEGLVPALPTADYVTTAKPKRNITAKVFKDCETTNIIERRLIKNPKGLKVLDCNTEQTKQFILRGNNRPLEPTARQSRVCRFRRDIQDRPA